MPRILLIDDDDSVRTVLMLTLKHFGYTVTEARNGNEGLEKFHQGGADLLITDIVMPEKDGLEVLMSLKRTQPTLKVIAISGGGRTSAQDYLQIARLMGATKVLEKPFTSEVLMAAVRELVGGGDATPPKPAPAV